MKEAFALLPHQLYIASVLATHIRKQQKTFGMTVIWQVVTLFTNTSHNQVIKLLSSPRCQTSVISSSSRFKTLGCKTFPLSFKAWGPNPLYRSL